MTVGLRRRRPSTRSVVPVPLAGALQTATPATPGVGPAELVDFWPVLVRAGWFLAGFLFVVLVGWLVVEPLVVRVIRQRNRNNPTIQEAISRYVRVLFVVVAFYVGAGAGGYGQFLTNSALVISAATLAVGVAGQQVIGSIISGLALVSDPEFGIGSYIEWEDGEGTVQSITLRITRVLSSDGELVTVPNTTLTGQTVVRPFSRGQYRIVDRVGLAYEDDVEEALRHLEAAAHDHDDVLADPAPTAVVDELQDDAIEVVVRYWIPDPGLRRIARVRSEYAQAITRRLDAAGITVSPASKRNLQGRIAVEDAS